MPFPVDKILEEQPNKDEEERNGLTDPKHGLVGENSSQPAKLKVEASG